jgi:hypothetical protein
MSEESTPQQPSFAQSPADMPDIENLADSDDAAVIEARAKLLKASASLRKASVPLLDRVILRGLLPLALAIVGPWAIWNFDSEQSKQGEVIVKMEKLLKDEKTTRQAREKELHAMSDMVCRLDDTLKAAMVQMAVAQSLASNSSREAVVEDVTGQMALPNLKPSVLRKMAGESYDRMSKRK